MANKWHSIDEITDAVTDELLLAMQKFQCFNSPHEGYAVILEELDEMWDAIKANDIKHARQEAIQVAAMAVRFVYDVMEKSQ